MARSPAMAKAKDVTADQYNHPVKEQPAGRLLKGPDGFVYTHTDHLARLPGFAEFTGPVDKSGFAKPAAAE